MNDPGLDGPIGEADGAVQDEFKESPDSDMDEEEAERSFLLPAKWWYASTAFPLIAGTFGPMANAFSICALVENWRVKVPKGGTEEHGIDIPDPKWLIAVNAVSLAFALIANLALLLNMARRVSFKIAQPITILGFWTASIMLIGLLAKASHDFHAPGVENQALTQAYYYGIFAAGLYQIVSYLMCVTVWGAYKGHYSKEFKLTVAQRTLMLQTISFLVYLLLGALVYSKIEGWKFLDAVYWADFTSLTIGIGDDYTPETHLGRGLLFPFAMGGIVILGLVVGSIRSLVLDRTKEKMAARITEKTRKKVVKRVATAAEASLEGNKKPVRRVTGLDKCTAAILTADPDHPGISELQRRRAEFDAMRRVQEMAAKRRKWFSLVLSTFAFAFLWIIGAFVFYKTEHNQGWSYFESLYFAYTTLLTIGYGDFEPQSNSGKPFFVFWSLLAIPTLTILISNMGDTVVKGIKDFTIWIGEVSVLPSEHGGIMDRLKFGLHKATWGKIDMERGDGRDPSLDEDADEDMKRFQELNPGLVHMYPEQGKRSHKHHRRTIEQGDELAQVFEQSEKQEEAEAHSRGDQIAQDDHHYRHILISQIRKVWTDSNADTPKQYSYAEWAYYLRLLGEDETDERFHRRPPTKSALADLKERQREARKRRGDTGDEEPTDVTTGGSAKRSDSMTKWSWMGPRSPLLANDDEPSWLLEKLFQRLEESLAEHWKEHKRLDGGGTEDSDGTARPGSEGTLSSKGKEERDEEREEMDDPERAKRVLSEESKSKSKGGKGGADGVSFLTSA